MNMGSRICGELDNSGVVDVCSNSDYGYDNIEREYGCEHCSL